MKPLLRGRVINCAHRGASGHAPENTLAALRLAVAMGADMAEIDVQQTADARLVLMHDPRLERTTTGHGWLWSKTLEELKTYDAGSWFGPTCAGEAIPTLEEAIALARGRMQLNIELKTHGHEQDLVAVVSETLARTGFIAACLITSFNHGIVEKIKARLPALRVGYIFDRKEYHQGLWEGPVEVLSANHRLVNAAFMARAAEHGKRVHVWTVNDPERMRRLIDLGAEAIITNFPDRLAALLRPEIKT